DSEQPPIQQTTFYIQIETNTLSLNNILKVYFNTSNCIKPNELCELTTIIPPIDNWFNLAIIFDYNYGFNISINGTLVNKLVYNSSNNNLLISNNILHIGEGNITNSFFIDNNWNIKLS